MTRAEVQHQVKPKSVGLLHACILEVTDCRSEEDCDFREFLLECLLDVVVVCTASDCSHADLLFKDLYGDKGLSKV